MNEIIHDFNEIQHEIKIYEKNRRGTLKKLKFFRLKDFNGKEVKLFDNFP